MRYVVIKNVSYRTAQPLHPSKKCMHKKFAFDALNAHFAFLTILYAKMDQR